MCVCVNSSASVPDFEEVEIVVTDVRLLFVHLLEQHHHRLAALILLRSLADVSVSQ